MVWGLDNVGPLHPGPRAYIHLFVAINKFTVDQG